MAGKSLSLSPLCFLHIMKALPLHKVPKKLALLFSFYFFVIHMAHAGMFNNISTKVKGTFFSTNTQKDIENPSVYKANVLSPVSLSAAADDSDPSALLEVKSGPMRLSTEEIDYPLGDTITTYEVKSGDTLASVAKLFNITVNTILWANDIPNKKIKEGDIIIVLPVIGIKYKAKEGETLAVIAKKYKGDVTEIARYNGIAEDAKLSVGDEVIIPDGEVDEPKPKQIAVSVKKIIKKLATTPLGFFVKPLANYVKTQGIHGKNGVDLGARVGTPVVATASGKVIVVKVGGYDGGYGNMIVIAHKNNIQTLYAHLSAVNVSQGSNVEQGQVIGAVGNTGRSTGPHLHIEVRGAANPF